MEKINLLLVTQHIPHYRIPIYNMISDRIGLTILHSQKNLDGKCNFNEVYVKTISLGPIFFYKINLFSFCNRYDVVIYESNIRFIDRVLITLMPHRKYKWISWGIGQAASYNKKLGDKDIYKEFRMFLQKRSDALILYSSFPKSQYIESGINPDSIFVANNTVSLECISEPSPKKDILLFIGSLYRQKRTIELIQAYKKSFDKCMISTPLFIIGDGEERKNLELYVESNKLNNSIFFLGNIEDSYILTKYFSRALACISPGQAGLSVLVSMANSVPFITKKNAITGGEIFNIDNNKTGVLYNNQIDLEYILCDINQKKSKYVSMGKSAKKHYVNHCLPEHMVGSIIDSIKYVEKKKQ